MGPLVSCKGVGPIAVESNDRSCLAGRLSDEDPGAHIWNPELDEPKCLRLLALYLSKRQGCVQGIA